MENYLCIALLASVLCVFGVRGCDYDRYLGCIPDDYDQTDMGETCSRGPEVLSCIEGIPECISNPIIKDSVDKTRQYIEEVCEGEGSACKMEEFSACVGDMNSIPTDLEEACKMFAKIDKCLEGHADCAQYIPDAYFEYQDMIESVCA